MMKVKSKSIASVKREKMMTTSAARDVEAVAVAVVVVAVVVEVVAANHVVIARKVLLKVVRSRKVTTLMAADLLADLVDPAEVVQRAQRALLVRSESSMAPDSTTVAASSVRDVVVTDKRAHQESMTKIAHLEITMVNVDQELKAKILARA